MGSEDLLRDGNIGITFCLVQWPCQFDEDGKDPGEYGVKKKMVIIWIIMAKYFCIFSLQSLLLILLYDLSKPVRSTNARHE